MNGSKISVSFGEQSVIIDELIIREDIRKDPLSERIPLLIGRDVLNQTVSTIRKEKDDENRRYFWDVTGFPVIANPIYDLADPADRVPWFVGHLV